MTSQSSLDSECEMKSERWEAVIKGRTDAELCYFGTCPVKLAVSCNKLILIQVSILTVAEQTLFPEEARDKLTNKLRPTERG